MRTWIITGLLTVGIAVVAFKVYACPHPCLFGC